MQYKQLGSLGIEVSEFALGCWPFAGGMEWGEQQDADSIAAVHTCLDAGINFFDTAEGYGSGKSEEVLGQALKGRRSRAVIATKVSAENLAPDEVKQSCDASLSRLDTDYIDLYLIHWPNHKVPISDTIGALNDLKGQGKVRSIGVCNFAVDDLAGLLEVGHVEVNQLPYGLLWRPIEQDILPECKKHGIGLMTYSPLMQGLLTGRYSHADEVPEGIARTRHFAGSRPQAVHNEPGMETELFEVIAGYRRFCEGLGKPMAHVALSWIRAQPGVTSILIGARNAYEVIMNLPALELELSGDEVKELNRLTDGIKSNLGTNADMWFGENRMR